MGQVVQNVQQTESAIEREADYAEAWGQTCRRAAMIVTYSLHILWTNEEGRRLLDTDTDLIVDGYRLAFAQRGNDIRFANFIENLGDDPEAWVLARQDGTSCLIIRVVRIELGHSQGLVLAFSDTSETRKLWADFSAALGLTMAEGNILKRLVDGESVVNVAADLGISIETARTHVKRSYAKLGVGNREEMFARISPFRMN